MHAFRTVARAGGLTLSVSRSEKGVDDELVHRLADACRKKQGRGDVFVRTVTES